MSYSFRDRTIINSSTATGFFSSANVITSSDFNALSINTDGFQGTVSGYASAGYNGTSYFNVIDKFPFATASTNATDVGDLSVTRGSLGSGQSSSVSGYTSGGTFFSPTPTITYYNVIDKFPFASNANATDVGDLTQSKDVASGSSSSVSGYLSGGQTFPATSQNTIEKFPFASDANATDVGDLTLVKYGGSGHSSVNHGYHAGGHGTSFSVFSNVIDKFPFASDANATDVGDIATPTLTSFHAGTSSTVGGYVISGRQPAPAGGGQNQRVTSFPFSTDANSTNIGNIGTGIEGFMTQSSTTHSYFSGGDNTPNFPAPILSAINRFPFGHFSPVASVGDLTVARSSGAGQQD